MNANLKIAFHAHDLQFRQDLNDLMHEKHITNEALASQLLMKQYMNDFENGCCKVNIWIDVDSRICVIGGDEKPDFDEVALHLFMNQLSREFGEEE